MSIKDIFFSDKNIQLLTRVLGDEMEIDNTKSAKEACRKLIYSQMELVYKKNKDKISSADPKKILPKLNEKSVDEALKFYAEHQRRNNKKPTKNDLSKQSDRKKQSFKSPNDQSNRSLNLRDNPKERVQGMSQKQKREGPQAMLSGGGNDGYAPLIGGDDGEYITATGEIGKKMFFGNINDQLSYGSKASGKDEIDRLLMMRRAEYEGGSDNYNMGGNSGIGGNGFDMNNNMGYGYNPNLGNNRPHQEINFCVDGGDTRGIANGNIDNKTNGFGGMGSMSGFGGMGGISGMNGMDNGFGGFGNFANNGSNDMNNMMGNYGMNMNTNYDNMNQMSQMNPMNPMSMSMSPMSMNPMSMNPMGMNTLGMNNNNSRNNTDLDAKIAQMEAERNNSFGGMHMQSPNMNLMNSGFNPMMMSNMMSMSSMNSINPMQSFPSTQSMTNQNFQKGGWGGNELEELIKDKKRELSNRLGLNPESLLNLSPEQIESLINTSGDNNKTNKSDTDTESDKHSDSDGSDESDEEDEKMKIKRKLLEKLQNKRKENQKNQKKLGNEVNTVLNKMNQKPNTKSNTKKSNNGSDSDNDSSEDDKSEDNNKKPSVRITTKSNDIPVISNQDNDNNKKRRMGINSENIKLMKRKDQDVKNSITSEIDESKLENMTLTIKSANQTEPEFYNDYQIDLDKEIENIKRIKIKGETDFPILRPIIDEGHNKIVIELGGEKIPIELEPDDGYTLNEIIDGINANLKEMNIEITVRIDEENHIIIENTDGKDFKIDLNDNSMGIYLGFTNDTYINKTTYRSENPHMFLETSYYMFINEIASEEPICEITPNGEVKQLVMDVNRINKDPIKKLTIQYKYDKTKNSDLVEFYGEPHEISFEISYLSNKPTTNIIRTKRNNN